MVVCAVREDVDVLPVDRVTGKPGMLSQCRRVEIWHLNSSLVLSQLLRKSTSGLSNIDLRTVNAVYNTGLLEIGHLVLRFWTSSAGGSEKA